MCNLKLNHQHCIDILM